MVVKTDGYLAHYGVSVDDGAPGRGSGRYAKGSGERPNQHGVLHKIKRAFKEEWRHNKAKLDILRGKDEDEYPYEGADSVKEYEESRRKYLRDNSEELLRKAREEDKWDMEFLEVADTGDIESRSKLYEAYKEYLKDPFEWEIAVQEYTKAGQDQELDELMEMEADEYAKSHPNATAKEVSDALKIDPTIAEKVVSERKEETVTMSYDDMKQFLKDLEHMGVDTSGFKPALGHSGVAHDENPPGRGSGRHPFGSGERPYQHEPASIREKLLKRKEDHAVSSALKKKKLQDEGSEAIMQAVIAGDNAKVKDLVAKYGKEAVPKKAVLKSEDPEFVYENRKKLSQKELEKVMERIGKEAELKKLVDSQKPKVEEPKTVDEVTNAKEAIIKSGDAKTVLKYQDQLTTTELEAAWQRIQKIQNLQNAAMPEVKKSNPGIFEAGFNLIKKAVVDEASKQATSAIQGGIAYGGYKLMEKALASKPELQKSVLSRMKPGDNKDKDKDKNNNQNNKKPAYNVRKEIQEIIDTGDLNKIIKNKSKMTDDEIQAAIARISNIQKLEGMAKKAEDNKQQNNQQKQNKK